MAGGNEPKSRPAGESSSNNKMFLNIKSQDGTVIHYKVLRDIRFQKLFQSYCDRRSLDYRTVQFLYDGVRVPVRKTPIDLHMEDGDEIDCLVSQHGGGW